MKKSKLILPALFALSIWAIITFSGCKHPDPDPEYTIKYEITGPTGTIVSTVIYFNETEAADTLSDVTIPWTKTIIVKGSHKRTGCGFSNYLNTNTYTCVIYVNEREVKRASSNSGATVTFITD